MCAELEAQIHVQLSTTVKVHSMQSVTRLSVKPIKICTQRLARKEEQREEQSAIFVLSLASQAVFYCYCSPQLNQLTPTYSCHIKREGEGSPEREQHM